MAIGRALLCLSAALVVAACDGGSEPPASTPPSGGGEGGAAEGSARLLVDGLSLRVIEGVEGPTQIVFLGADDALVSEKGTGRIRRVRDGRVESEPVLQLAANTADERGVLGLTLHPAFDDNRYVYVYWTWRGGGEEPDALFGEATDAIDDVPPLGNRIDRFVWDGDGLQYDRNIIRLPSRTTELTLDRTRGNHNGGVIDFGPDGKLYAVIGDQNDRGPLQNVAGGEARSGIDSIAGALLRLNDDGSIPDDNPFAGRVDDLALEAVFAYGIRNSYGYDWDPATGALWLTSNGQASYDQLGRYEGGDNLGWVQIMGPPERFDDYRALEVATERQLDSPAFPPEMLAQDALQALSRLVGLSAAPPYYRPPLLSWRAAVAPAATQFVRGGALGPAFEGTLLLGDVNTGSIYRLELSPDRSDLALDGPLADRVNDNADNAVGELSGHVIGSGFLTATDIEQAPDGSLWITSLAGNAVYRIAPR